jgi:hypothetical protein
VERRAPEIRVGIDRLKTWGKSRADAADAKNRIINDGGRFFSWRGGVLNYH